MRFSLHRHVDLNLRQGRIVRRRDLLRAIPLAAGLTGSLSWPDLMALHASQLRQRGMACILLWMQGGPSQFETFSPKPDHSNGGDTQAISTAVAGLQISDNLPQTAEVMDEVCLIRSMTSREGSHPRATYLLHTGYLPTASVKYPTFGSIVAKQNGNPTSDLPSFVRIGARGRRSPGAGLLGVEHDPFNITDPRRAPDNTAVPTAESRYRRRLGLLSKLESEYEQSGGEKQVGDHRKLYEKASQLVLSPRMNAFDVAREPDRVRESYGDSQFASGCLMARRLIEAGVTFVEVHAGNWDTHQDNFNRSKELCGQIDQPYAALIRDLRGRGLLDRTLIVWMGEFGRTPRINPRGGRDHYPRAFSAALAGGGVRGGQVIGATDAGGQTVADRPVGVADLFRTLCHSLKIDADGENMSSIGRPIPFVDGGELVDEVFG